MVCHFRAPSSHRRDRSRFRPRFAASSASIRVPLSNGKKMMMDGSSSDAPAVSLPKTFIARSFPRPVAPYPWRRWTTQSAGTSESIVRAVDTNVLVRLIALDDAKQLAAAERFVEAGAWVSHLVLIETTWVLDSVFK